MFERAQSDDVGAIYLATIARVGDVLRDAPPGADARRVPACPDWMVADLLAHLSGTPAALLQRSYPGDDSQAWVDGHVDARRGRSALDNWQEWSQVGPEYARLLDKNEAAWGSILYDAIVHEDDLRGALGREPAGEARATAYALDRLLGTLDEVAVGVGIGSLEIRSGEATWIIGDGAPVVRLRSDDRWELLRSLGSRRSEARVRAMAFDGDPAAWIGIAPHPLPTDDAVD